MWGVSATVSDPAPTVAPARRVMVVDDHRVWCDALAYGLDGRHGVRCVSLAHTLAEARTRLASTPVEGALVDLCLPDGSGLDLVAPLLAADPACRVVMISAHPRPDLKRAALAAGAVGLLAKEVSLNAVVAALRDGHVGSQRWEDRSVGAAALTAREHEVLALLATGLDVRAIAKRMELSVYTVRDHVRAVLAKLGAHSQLEAIVNAAQLGLVDLGRR